jgi:hypothetical protein
MRSPGFTFSGAVSALFLSSLDRSLLRSGQVLEHAAAPPSLDELAVDT